MRRLTAEDFPNYDVDIYSEEQENCAYEDDCAIHVVRNGQRIVFYKGQGDGAYGEKDIPRFEKIVDKVLNKKESPIKINRMKHACRDHKERHQILHRCLDELVADMLMHTNELPSKMTVLELMRWSSLQTISPTI